MKKEISFCVRCMNGGISKKIKHRNKKKSTYITVRSNNGMVENILNLHCNYCRKCRRKLTSNFYLHIKQDIRDYKEFINKNVSEQKLFDKKKWSKDMSHLTLGALND